MTYYSIVQLTVNPDRLDEARSALHEVLADTRAFDGCTSVDVAVSEQDPAAWTMVERWSSKEHSAAYSAWRAGEGKSTAMAGLYAAPPAVNKYSVDERI